MTHRTHTSMEKVTCATQLVTLPATSIAPPASICMQMATSPPQISAEPLNIINAPTWILSSLMPTSTSTIYSTATLATTGNPTTSSTPNPTFMYRVTPALLSAAMPRFAWPVAYMLATSNKEKHFTSIRP